MNLALKPSGRKGARHMFSRVERSRLRRLWGREAADEFLRLALLAQLEEELGLYDHPDASSQDEKEEESTDHGASGPEEG